ncbi:MAG TPA: hypothetical protein VKV26_19570 [Dehalococcoidia bacterium]|nr:hypothetical protein [Dehalococcoidia bacterium]
MNLFRSEEHARRWAEFDPAFAELLQPLDHWAERFSAPLFRNRGRADYITWLLSERAGRRPTP